MKSILQIICEEIQNFYSDWRGDDEPSLADKYYEKRGIRTSVQQAQIPINAEFIGYVDKQWQKSITPVPVYKNPRSLEGFTNDTRGILLSNGDFYVAQSYNALHDNILEMLAEKGIVPLASTFHYDQKYPEAFVAVQRASSTKVFGQSMAYDMFPPHYQEIFDTGNQNQPYVFKEISID